MTNDNTPSAIECQHDTIGLSMHPNEPIAIVGLISGQVEIWQYHRSAEQDRRHAQTKVHDDSCRVVCCNTDGSKVMSGSADKSIALLDMNGSVVWKHSNAHENAVNCLYDVGSGNGVFVSGDEEGEIKLWDPRDRGSVLSTSKEHIDYISDMTMKEDTKTLLTASGDGSVGVYDLKMGFTKLVSKETSISREDDCLSIQIVRSGSKVVVGTQEGMLNFFQWGKWDDIDDRFPGHPSSIESILKVDESTICTGSIDGMIRIVNLYPHKLLGVIGDHADFPIERLGWTFDRSAIASTSHDSVVRFWDATCLQESSDEDNEDEEDEEDESVASDTENAGKNESSKKVVQKHSSSEEDDDDDDDDDDDADDSSDDSDNEKTPRKKRKVKKNPEIAQRRERIQKKSTFAKSGSKNRDFFSDL